MSERRSARQAAQAAQNSQQSTGSGAIAASGSTQQLSALLSSVRICSF